VPAVFCTGNHDDRDAFAAVLGSGHLDAAGRDAGRLLPGGSGQRAAVSHAAGHRVVTLDSLVPGEVHGRVDPAQLRWLREVLATPHSQGSVVVLHHPPVAVAGTVQEHVGLRDPDELAAALDGTDVRIVLCGHYHLQLAGRLGDVPVWVSPGVVTRIDLTAPRGLERAVRGAGAGVVDLDGPGAPLCHTVHARDPRAGQQVYLVDAASGADVPDEEPAAAPGPGLDGRSPEPAVPADAGPLLALREAASAWLAARSVRQWEAGEVTLEDVREQVDAGQWHVLREHGEPVAALRLLWQDEQVWGLQPPVAGYVHGLVVAERHRGSGVGACLLRWAAEQARARGRSLLRLDCGEENDALRRWYAEQGFRAVARRDADGRWYSVVLLERPL
jgi:3',5'-cyclic-AMP phosphodiesterase